MLHSEEEQILRDSLPTRWAFPAKTPLEAELRKRFPTLKERQEFLDSLEDEKREAFPAPPKDQFYRTPESEFLQALEDASDIIKALEKPDIEQTLREEIEARVEERALGLSPRALTETMRELEQAEKDVDYLRMAVNDIKSALARIRKRVESLA